MSKVTGDISRYKVILRKLKISHQAVADYTGHTRENVTLLLNGHTTSLRVAKHMSEEIDELIALKS